MLANKLQKLEERWVTATKRMHAQRTHDGQWGSIAIRFIFAHMLMKYAVNLVKIGHFADVNEPIFVP